MAVFYDIPVEDLPESIRKSLPENVTVNITVEVADGSLPGYTNAQLDDMLSFSEEDVEAGTVLQTREDIERHMNKLKEQAKTNWQRESAALRKLA